MSDRADQIAQETVRCMFGTAEPLVVEGPLVEAIASALRSYADEKLREITEQSGK